MSSRPNNAGPNSLSKIHGIVQVDIARRQQRTRREWLGVDDDGAEDDGEAVCVGVCETEKNLLAPVPKHKAGTHQVEKQESWQTSGATPMPALTTR